MANKGRVDKDVKYKILVQKEQSEKREEKDLIKENERKGQKKERQKNMELSEMVDWKKRRTSWV